MKKAFSFDANRCTGCHACILACANENRLPPGRPWRRVHTFNPGRHPSLPRLHLSMACNHCETPACLLNCPANAFCQDVDTGAVTLDSFRCLGCRYCTWACPFDAPQYNVEKGVVEKCDFCISRLRRGQEPACTACCPTDALQLVDRTTSDTGDLVGLTRSSLGPALSVAPLRGGAPKATAAPAASTVSKLYLRSLARPKKKITLRSEWALLVFTFLAALLTAALTAATVIGYRMLPWPFLAGGVAAMILSTLHLGRKERAYFSIANWRRSWLSLEILFFSLFLGISGLHLLFLPFNRWLGWLGVGAGFLTLMVIDGVYRVTRRTGWLGLHSGQVFLTGIYLAGIFARQALPAVCGGTVKLALFLLRKGRRLPTGTRNRWIDGLRLMLGFVIPGAAWFFFSPGFWLAAVVAAIAGDFIDRGQFYQGLEVDTPEGQMHEDLKKSLALLGEETHGA